MRPAICHLLTEKSATVKWRRVYAAENEPQAEGSQTEQLAQHDPNKNMYEESLLDTHYPKRPESLSLQANYSWQSTDDKGKRKYTKLK